MSVDALLSRCTHVRKTGAGRWLVDARCHESKSHRSVAVRELEDGRVLLHCFGGCSVEEVLSALDLDFDALFPERPIDGHHARRERRPHNAHDILACCAFEVLVIHQASTILLRGEVLSAVDHARLVTAAGRIGSAYGIANGGA